MIAEGRVDRDDLEQGRERGLGDLVGVAPVAAGEDQIRRLDPVAGAMNRVQITVQVAHDQDAQSS